MRNVINSGQKTFDEFLSLHDKSQRFRDWAKGVNPDEKIVKEYLEAVTSEGWINKLPAKLIRYFVCEAIGAIEPFSGKAISVADSFILDKLVGGWKPSHFVEGRLKPFVSSE